MKINSASRLHTVMTEWKSVAPDEAALKAWLRVLGLSGENKSRDYIAANQRIQLLLDELDLLRGKLYSAKVSEAVYQPPLSKLENALSPALVTAKAQHIKQHLTEDVYTGLAFCSELLPIEEDSISEDDFRDMVGLINQLELLLQENEFPASLAALIRRHIRFAEMAMAQYPIRGATAVKEAVKAAVGDLVFESEALSQTSKSNAKLIEKLWRKANTMADGAIKTDNLLQMGARAMKLLSDITDKV